MRTPVRSLVACSIAAMLSITLSMILASPAKAGFPLPDPTLSSIGTAIDLGGSVGGVVDPVATKTIIVRDNLNFPIPNSVVVITFTNCTNQDIRLCDAQPHHPGTLFDCAGKRVSAVTNAIGVATFRVAGGATNPGGNPPGVAAGCATVHADGVPLGILTVGAPDENGIGGVDVADLSAFASDRFGLYRGRSDFDGNNIITVADLSIFAQFRFSQASTASCASVCP